MFARAHPGNSDEAHRSSYRLGRQAKRRRASRFGLGLGLEWLEDRIVPAFVGPVSTPITAGTVGMVVADFNGDGKPDIATENTSLDQVEVMLGNGDGTFQPQVGYFAGTQAPTGLVAGDFNGDGRVNLGVLGGDLATFAPVIHVLPGNGNGTFIANPNAFPQPDTTPLGAGYGSALAPLSGTPLHNAVTVADINHDGRLDVLAVNPRAGTVEDLLGNGDGTFQPAVVHTATAGVLSVTAADLNHDGRLDLVLANPAEAGTVESFTILLGNGDGSFGAPTSEYGGAGTGTASLAVGDLNGDGKPDIATVTTGGTVSLWAGNGDGIFQSPTPLAGLVSAHTVNISDINADGIPDLIDASDDVLDKPNGVIGVRLGIGDGTFQPEVNYADEGDSFLTLSDLNGDGHLDLAGINLATSSLEVFKGNTGGTFTGPIVYNGNHLPYVVNNVNPAPTGSTPSVFFADFNGDGIQDKVIANTFGDTISTFLGNAGGTFQTPITFTPQNVNTLPQLKIIAAGDFNGDGKPDIIVYNPGLPEQLIGGGGETHRPTTIIPGTPAEDTLYLGNGDGAFTASTVRPALLGPASTTAVADLDGDGIDDTITAFGNGPDTNGVVSIQVSSSAGIAGNPIPSQNYLIFGTPQSLVVTDVNGDNHPDIVVTTKDSNDVWILLNLEGGQFFAVEEFSAYTPPAGSPNNAYGTFGLALADFDQDGKLDIAVGTALGQVSILKGNGDGTFQSGVTSDVGGVPISLAVSDFNNDGLPDIAASIGPAGNPIPIDTVAFNNGGEVLAGAVPFRVSAPSTSAAGQPVSVTVAAVNANGIPVAGFRGTVHLGTGDPQATGTVGFYTFTAADNGTHVFTNAFALDTAGAEPITATNPRMTTGVATVHVTPLAASAFLVSTPATSIVAGTAAAVTVTAVDPLGNVAPGYAGTVHFTSTDPKAMLPLDYTFTPVNGGVHSFTATLTQVGATVLVADAAGLAGSIVPNVTPLAASTFRITTALSASVVAGATYGLIVSSTDIYGNPVPGFAGTLHFASSDRRAILPADFTFPASSNGVAGLGISFETAGTQSITIGSATTGTLIIQGGIGVWAGAFAAVSVGGSLSATAGAAHSATITAQDTFGNVITGFVGTVHFTSSDAQAVLPADYTFTAADAGVHVFATTFKTAGSQSISVRANDGLGTTASGAQSGIVVGAAAAASFTVAGFPATTAGVAQSFTVTVRDAFGNVATGYSGSLHFSSSDLQAGLPVNDTFTAADAGIHTFTATLKTAGTQSLSVQEVGNSLITGSQSGIVVTAAAVSRLAIVGPTSSTSGSSFKITVTAVNAFGNTVTSYRGKVHFSDSLAAGLPSDYTFSNNDNGAHTFSITLTTVGVQTFTITDLSNQAIMGAIVINVSSKSGGGH